MLDDRLLDCGPGMAHGGELEARELSP